MNILAFDAAAAACSAVLWQDGHIVSREWRGMARGHAEALVPMIAQVMDGNAYDRLSAIAVTVGPGGFTGLRIALATARGLSLATGVPAIGVTNFEVVARMAGGAREEGDAALVVALETKRNDLYLQAFGSEEIALTVPASVELAEIGNWLPPGVARLSVTGDAAGRFISALPAGIVAAQVSGAELPDAAAVAVLAAERLAGAPVSPETVPLTPLYLRPPDATVPKASRRR